MTEIDYQAKAELVQNETRAFLSPKNKKIRRAKKAVVALGVGIISGLVTSQFENNIISIGVGVITTGITFKRLLKSDEIHIHNAKRKFDRKYAATSLSDGKFSEKRSDFKTALNSFESFKYEATKTASAPTPEKPKDPRRYKLPCEMDNTQKLINTSVNLFHGNMRTAKLKVIKPETPDKETNKSQVIKLNA